MVQFFDTQSEYLENIALKTSEGLSLSYRELWYHADQLCEKLSERHIVFVSCQNNYESLLIYLGALRKKVIPVLLPSDLDSELFESLLESYQPKYLFTSHEMVNPNYSKIDSLNSFVIYESSFEQDYSIDPALGLLLTTSGSTGSPKFVRLSYENICANATSIATYLAISPLDVAITTMPMNYTYGLSIINSHLLMGATIALNNFTVLQKEFWTFFKAVKPTTFGGVPYIYEMLKKLRIQNMDLSSIRYLTQAGGKLSVDLTAFYNQLCLDKGIQFIVMYGQTEATARMAYLPWERAIEKKGSMGIPIPGGKMHLIDDDGTEIIGAGIVGELVYTGPNVSLGYSENRFELGLPDANKGVLFTGDVAVRDEDGYYAIVGRKKRFIKLFGLRVNLDEVEQLIRVTGVECACTGTDEVLRIYLTGEASHRDMQKYIATKTGLSHTAIQVLSVPSIPRNESGKILYSQLE